jgi:hypothetical protein
MVYGRYIDLLLGGINQLITGAPCSLGLLQLLVPLESNGLFYPQFDNSKI